MMGLIQTLLHAITDRLTTLRDGWNWFWFTPADPLMLGFARVVAGSVLFWVLLVTGPLLNSFYGPEAWIDQPTANLIRTQTPYIPPLPSWDPDDGPDTRQGIEYQPELNRSPDVPDYARRWNLWPGYTYSMGQPQFSPYFHASTPAELWTTHVLCLTVVALFTLGVATRITSVLAWIVTLSYSHRVTAALFGMDTMMALTLLYLMIGPSGDALSLDRWWAMRRRGLPVLGTRPEPSVMAGVALRLFHVHFAFIYLASGTTKLQGPAWWNGTAIWQTLSNYEFSPERLPGYTAMLRWLTQDRWVWELAHSGGTVFTLLLEIGFIFLVWYRGWRTLMVLGAVMLHTGISLTMGLHSFSIVMIAMVLTFLDPDWVRSLFTRSAQGQGVKT